MPEPSAPAERPPAALAWYATVRGSAAIVGALFGPQTTVGREHVPRVGGALLVANHASFLDVLVLGVAMPRPLNFVARSTLFVGPLGWMIRSVGAFPIQREGIGASGVKETLRRARKGGIVALFPEGTRSDDGRLADLRPGIAALAQRAGVPVIPVAIAGTFAAWPRHKALPEPGPVRVDIGPAIEPGSIAGLETGDVTALIQARIQQGLDRANAALALDRGDPPGIAVGGAAYFD